MPDNWDQYADYSTPDKLNFIPLLKPLQGLVNGYNRRQAIAALQWSKLGQVGTHAIWDWATPIGVGNDFTGTPAGYPAPIDPDDVHEFGTTDVLLMIYNKVKELIPFYFRQTASWKEAGYSVPRDRPAFPTGPYPLWTAAEFIAHVADVLAYDEPPMNEFCLCSAKAIRWVHESIRQLKWTGTQGYGRRTQMQLPKTGGFNTYSFQELLDEWAASPLGTSGIYEDEDGDSDVIVDKGVGTAPEWAV